MLNFHVQLQQAGTQGLGYRQQHEDVAKEEDQEHELSFIPHATQHIPEEHDHLLAQVPEPKEKRLSKAQHQGKETINQSINP